MSSIFGGSKSKQSSTSSASSSNQAYGTLNQQYSPLLQYANSGVSALNALLNGDNSGFLNYKNATGFNAAAEAGSRGITGNAAASGLLRSGSTAKALQTYGDTIQNQFANDYIDKLLAQINAAYGAGQLISGAGNTSSSQGSSYGTSKSNNGFGSFIGSLIGAAAAG